MVFKMANPKYRTHDSAVFVEPFIEWPPSLTDPSQHISIERLINDQISRGKPPPEMYFGVDLSRMDFTEAHAGLQHLEELKSKQLAEEGLLKKKAEADLQAAAEARLLKVVGQLQSSDLKPGSPEIQALAAELTGILPGFKAAVITPKE